MVETTEVGIIGISRSRVNEPGVRRTFGIGSGTVEVSDGQVDIQSRAGMWRPSQPAGGGDIAFARRRRKTERRRDVEPAGRPSQSQPSPPHAATSSPTAPPGGPRQTDQSDRGEPPRTGWWGWWTQHVYVPIIVALIGAVTVIGGVLVPWWLRDEPPPDVEIADVSLRERGLSAENVPHLVIAYSVRLTGHEDDRLTVMSEPLDARTRQPVTVGTAASPQGAEAVGAIVADGQEAEGTGTFTLEYPATAGCVVIRLSVHEEDGDELAGKESAPFDPYAPANPDCPPMGGPSVQPEGTT